MRSYYEDIYKTIRKFVGEREITAQEAALDAVSESIIKYSCALIYVQARRPRDTVHTVRRAKDRAKRQCRGDALTFEDMVYDSHVQKYINRMWTVSEYLCA